MPQADYILKMIEQVAEMIQRAVSRRENGQTQIALETAYVGMERLFGLSMQEISSLSSDALFKQLTAEENSLYASDKCYAFAGLNYQAGLTYEAAGKPDQAQPAFNLALLFVLRASALATSPALPPYAPTIAELVLRLKDAVIWPQSRELLDGFQRGQDGKTPSP